jgi:hypothetical protein
MAFILRGLFLTKETPFFSYAIFIIMICRWMWRDVNVALLFYCFMNFACSAPTFKMYVPCGKAETSTPLPPEGVLPVKTCCPRRLKI